MPRVVHFETPAEDPERAAKFYADVFGWQTQKWEGPEDYWLIRTGEQGPGIDGAFMKPCAEGGFAPRTPVCTIDVPSVDEALAKIEASGGKVVMPRMEVPGVGFLAYFADTEGVISGIMQFALKAPAAS
ncbi:MAG TPA: VOC family protein [Armatimonadaceae bacterium]|jgi:predicted enzyme related to lactoylglutathione lyase|nr:VOC family protein [Armatimonadaceae bacterium]